MSDALLCSCWFSHIIRNGVASVAAAASTATSFVSLLLLALFVCSLKLIVFNCCCYCCFCFAANLALRCCLLCLHLLACLLLQPTVGLIAHKLTLARTIYFWIFFSFVSAFVVVIVTGIAV